MNRIVLSFTKEEIRELAKQLYLGSYITVATPDYENEDLSMQIMNKVCKAGYYETPEAGIFGRPITDSEPPYYINNELEEECKPLLEKFKIMIAGREILEEIENHQLIKRFGKPFSAHLLLDPIVGEEVSTFLMRLEEDFRNNGFANYRYVNPSEEK